MPSPTELRRHGTVRLALLLLVLGACAAPPEPPPAPGVVARVDSLHITADQVHDFVRRAPSVGESPAAQRASYVRSLVARHLLVDEARARGLDTTSTVRRKIDADWRQHLLRRYQTEVVWSGVAPTKAQMTAYFDSLGLGRQRGLWGIRVASQADARQVRSLLRLGRPFEELARQRSVHAPSAARGGELGFVSLGQARALDIPDSVFHRLPDGEVSGILPQGDGFQLIRFDGERTARLDEHGDAIHRVLVEQLRRRRAAELADRLAERLRWRLEPAGWSQLQASLDNDGRLQRWQLDPQEANQPLFSYEGGFVALGEFVNAVGEQDVDWSEREAVVRWAGDEVRDDRLFFADALRRGLDRDAADWKAARAERHMVVELRRQILAERSGVATPADGRGYYDRHPELFREADDLILVEALLDSARQATDLRAAVEAGADFAELAAARTQREETLWQAPGTIRLGPHERLTMRTLFEAAQAAQVGVLTGPVAVDGGYSLFRVVHRQPGALTPFAQVDRRATALAKHERDVAAFEGFVDELLGKHADRVRVFEAELEAALPDSFLLRLAETRAAAGAGPG